MSGAMMTTVLVEQLPFWRWAVAIAERPDLPAVAFYRKASACSFASEVKRCFPDRTVQLLRRRLVGVETVGEA